MVHLSIRVMVGMEGEVLAVEVECVEEVAHFVEGDVVMVANLVDIMIMVNLWHHQSQVEVSYNFFFIFFLYN